MDTIKKQELMEETNVACVRETSLINSRAGRVCGCAVSYLTRPCWQSQRPICFNEKHTHVNTDTHTFVNAKGQMSFQCEIFALRCEKIELIFVCQFSPVNSECEHNQSPK